MFQLFDTIGTFIRSAFAVGFAAFWGWSSMLLNGHRMSDMQIFSIAGMILMVGRAGAAIFAGFYALICFIREDVKGKPASVTPEAAVVEPSFDPDAIIARHLAIRATMPARRTHLPAVHRPLAAGSGFGRKLA